VTFWLAVTSKRLLFTMAAFRQPDSPIPFSFERPDHILPRLRDLPREDFEDFVAPERGNIPVLDSARRRVVQY
jgi:hypothetical protein